MPGIWGLAGATPDDGDEGLFREMGRRLRRHDFYVEQAHRCEDGPMLGRISLGIVDKVPQPARNDDRSLVVVMDGEIYDQAEHWRNLEDAGCRPRGEGPAALLLHGYGRRGRDFFRDLNGSFTAAIWDARAGRLILACDRFGMKPLYYAHRPGRLLFSPEIKALLADPLLSREPNAAGLAQFFTFGHFLNQDTFLGEVAVLPAAGWLSYDVRSDRLAVDRYWRLEPRPGELMGTAEAFERLDGAFKRAVDRRVAGPHRLGVSLSGGMDSRTILGAIDPGRRPLTTVSLGLAGSIDVLAAEQMARLTGCEHRRYELDAGFLGRYESHLRQAVDLTDGHYLCQCIVMPTLPLYRELGIEVLLRGHAGELMHMDKAYNFSLDGEALALRDEDGLERWLLRRLRAFMIEDNDRPLFRPKYQASMESLSREALRAGLAESRGIDPPAERIAHLFLTQRVRRETALSMVEFGSLVETRLPFLDNEVIDLLFATPTGLKIGESIQAEILRRRMPAFLDIPNANTGARPGAGRFEKAIGRTRLRVLSKLRVRGYQPYERIGLWLRRELLPLVERLLLSDRCLDRGIFDPETVRAVVRQHAASRHNHTYLILAMMIFEQGQRMLLDGEAADRRDGGRGAIETGTEIAPELSRA